jgi:cystathionine beta-lyase/cystathionine gamma-synthase
MRKPETLESPPSAGFVKRAALRVYVRQTVGTQPRQRFAHRGFTVVSRSAGEEANGHSDAPGGDLAAGVASASRKWEIAIIQRARTESSVT